MEYLITLSISVEAETRRDAAQIARELVNTVEDHSDVVSAGVEDIEES